MDNCPLFTILPYDTTHSKYNIYLQITKFYMLYLEQSIGILFTIDDLFSEKKPGNLFIVARLTFITKTNPNINSNFNGCERFVPPCRPFNKQPGPAVPFPLFLDSP